MPLLLSWLQKSIRRCDAEGAVFAAVETYCIGVQRVISNLFNRLRIIAIEDIGIACPEAIIVVDKGLRSLCNLKGKPFTEITVQNIEKLAELVAWMANQDKSRLCSEYRAQYYKEAKPTTNYEAECKKEALSLVNNPRLLADHLKDKLKERDPACGYYLHLLEQLAGMKQKLPTTFFSTSKIWGLVFDRLFQVFLNKNMPVDHLRILVKWMKNGLSEMREREIPALFCVLLVLFDAFSQFKVNPSTPVRIINFEDDWCTINPPDAALDKHTPEGRRLGRGKEHFLQEGARIYNEPGWCVQPIWKAVYQGKPIEPEEEEELLVPASPDDAYDSLTSEFVDQNKLMKEVNELKRVFQLVD